MEDIVNNYVTRETFIATMSSIGDKTTAIGGGGDFLVSAEAASLLFDQISASAAFGVKQAGLQLAVIVAAFSVASSTDVGIVCAHVFASYNTDDDDTLTLGELSGYLEVALAYRLMDRAPPRDEEDDLESAIREHAEHSQRSKVFANALAKRTFNEMDQDHR